jgi:pectate lyase
LTSRLFTTIQENELLDDVFKIYPSPVEDKLFINGQTALIESIRIYDLKGAIIHEFSGALMEINLNHLSAGNYVIQINTELGTVSKKIIKK